MCLGQTRKTVNVLRIGGFGLLHKPKKESGDRKTDHSDLPEYLVKQILQIFQNIYLLDRMPGP